MHNYKTQLHRLIASALLLCGTGSLLHAQSLKELFLKMPQKVCPALSEYNRLEIVDNQKNGKPMRTRNLLSTFSEMKVLTDDYAHISTSKSSEKELKLLTKNDNSRLIMVISTVYCDSVPDSSVSFYDTNWQPLRTLDFFTLPASDNFRKITIEPSTNQLTVTSCNIFRLRTDGSDTPLPLQVSTDTFYWLTEENRFVLAE